MDTIKLIPFHWKHYERFAGISDCYVHNSCHHQSIKNWNGKRKICIIASHTTENSKSFIVTLNLTQNKLFFLNNFLIISVSQTINFLKEYPHFVLWIWNDKKYKKKLPVQWESRQEQRRKIIYKTSFEYNRTSLC